ncbi:MAG: hypothetical protein IJA83_04345 [Clostridia bacterium]|nr:hypothetical protein [Clostridia bacterium]
MKKLIALLLLMCLLPLCAAAEMDEDGNVIVDLGDAEIFFTHMEGYCLTRESSASVFNRLGMSQREIVSWMEQNDVYALLFSETLDIQIQIVAHPSTEMDFDEQTQFGLNMMCEAVENIYTTEGYDVESAEMCHTPNGHSYVRTSATNTYEDGYVENMTEFFTCQSGYSVYVVMFTLEGAPTEEQVILCEGIVDSLWLSKNVSNGAEE